MAEQLAESWCVVTVTDPLVSFYKSLGWATSARAHVPLFPYLGNGFIDGSEIWCVVRELSARHFTKL